MSTMNETVSNIEVIGAVRRNPSSILKVSVGEFNRRTYVYCQAWDKDEQDEGPGEPTFKGLTFRPDTLRGLLPLFSKALEKAAARRQIKP
jgi:hypothetical protein